MRLAEQNCQKINPDAKPLQGQDAKNLLEDIPGWALKDGAIEKNFKFNNFRESIKFVNRIADIAEQQGHHPDMCINYNEVRIDFTTHKIHGLSLNDFIMAAKIDVYKEGR